MALDTNATKLTNMVNPQVLADMIDHKLVDDMRFAPLCTLDYTLQGRPGSTVTLPQFAYIGDATVVAEGADIPISQLTTSTATVTIHKLGKAVQITDEALLSGYGNPYEEAAKQIRLAIASKLDYEVLSVLEGIGSTMTYTGAAVGILTASDIAKALIKFGEDLEGEKVLLVSPSTYNVLLADKAWIPASEIAADMVIKGAVGEIQGCQVVISNKLASTDYAYIVKPGALRIYMKRDTMVEADRDIINDTNVISANKHEVAYLYDASKAIKLVKKSVTTLSALSFTGITLSPTFDKDTISYTGTGSSTSTTITATATDAADTVTVKVGGVEAESSSLTLVAGKNTVTVEVKDSEKPYPTTTYTAVITITEEE